MIEFRSFANLLVMFEIKARFRVRQILYVFYPKMPFFNIENLKNILKVIYILQSVLKR